MLNATKFKNTILLFVFILSSANVNAAEEYQWNKLLLPNVIDGNFENTCRTGIPLSYCKKSVASIVALRFIDKHNQYYAKLLHDRFNALTEDEKQHNDAFDRLVVAEQRYLQSYWLKHARLPDIPNKKSKN